MNKRARLRALLLALLFGVSPIFAQAQSGAVPDPAMEKHIGKRIGQLHDQLGITPAEQPQWDQFAAVMRTNAMHMKQIFAERAAAMNGSALDDLRAYAKSIADHAEDVSNLARAFEPLYGAMTPEQRKIADNVFHQYAREQTLHMPHG